MSKLTTGEKALRANIRAMKKIGRENARKIAAQKVANYLAHVERNNCAAEQAAQARLARIATHQRGNEIAHMVAVEKNSAHKLDDAQPESIAEQRDADTQLPVRLPMAA